LTSNKLFTAVTSALRSCRDMNVIERNRKGLEMIINASSSLLKLPSLKQFTSGVLTQLTSILGFEDNSLLLQTADGTCGFAATAAQGNYKIIAGTGHYEKYVNQCVTDLDNENVMEDINQAIRRKMNNFKDKSVVCYFKTHNNIENILYLQSRKRVNKTDRNMIDIFLSNVAIAFDNLYHRENLEKLVEERTFDLQREKETVAKAHKVLSKYVPPQLTERILAGEIEDVWESSRKRLTMFFSDIKDFTKLTESMEPEDLATLLNGYFTEMNDIANRYGGVVVDFTGDGLFIFFGAPDATTDREHALNCVRMAIAMQKRIVDLGKKWFEEGIEEPLQNRCGINTGMVNVGGFGSVERKKYGAQGVHVNLASRLEAACEPGQILISHSTWALVKDEIACEPKGKLEVKGLSHRVRAYNVCLDETDEKTDLL